MNFSADGKKLTLHIRGIGPVISFKNSKLVRNNKPITKPEYQEWMEKAIQQLKYQLRCLFPTTTDETAMAHFPPSLTALLKHSKDFDDKRQWIPSGSFDWVVVEKGAEGADITIEIL